MKEASLPPIFSQYAGLVRYVKQVTDTEFSSGCPKCGGDVHDDHSWPDRCRWFMDAHPLGWCRRCGTLFWPDKQPGWTPIPAEEMERWRKEQEAKEGARKRSAMRALENLRSEHMAEQYHAALGKSGYDYWWRRGIPKEYVDWWQLGICAAFPIRRDGAELYVCTATIPLMDKQGQVQNIKHRILGNTSDGDKYRYEIAGLGHPLFLANPTASTGQIIVIEGEIKAMVVFVTLGDKSCYVVGLPGVTPGESVIAELRKAERITLVLDPGAETQAVNLARRIGAAKCRVVVPPGKIDDEILALHLGARQVRWLLSTARRVMGR